METYADFLKASRKIQAESSRVYPGWIRDVFCAMFPHTDVTGWTEHDFQFVVSYHLNRADLQKGGKEPSEKALMNYKAAKIMLSDLERGRSMMHEDSKSIQNILNSTLTERNDPMTTSTAKNPADKSAADPKHPGQHGKSIRKIILDSIIAQKLTDEQIAAEVKKEVGKVLRPQYLASHRRRLNKGVFVKFGYAKPVKPYEAIGGKKSSAAKPSADAAVKKPSAPAKTAAKPPLKKIVKK